MSYAFDFLTFIGRFQPYHNGHLEVVRAALQQTEKLIILIGSAWQPRSTRNPWTYEERCLMIRESLPTRDVERVLFAPMMDVLYNDEVWVRNVQNTVLGLVTAHFERPHQTPRLGLVGHRKDRSSFYLKLFPQWDSVAVENQARLDATSIRKKYFAKEAVTDLPQGSADFLERFRHSPAFDDLYAEQVFVDEYRRGWDLSPYPPTFVTVDAVVVQSGHVLMIERKARPGKGLLALPGGFVNQQETLLDACLRELREETRLKVPTPVLKGSIRQQRMFDDPHRSSRGRTITQAFLIELEAQTELPKVKGGDDARQAFWKPLAELDPQRIFEDHYFIIQSLLGL